MIQLQLDNAVEAGLVAAMTLHYMCLVTEDDDKARRCIEIAVQCHKLLGKEGMAQLFVRLDPLITAMETAIQSENVGG